ncbi:prenyltransferase/squalene oxidase repeat-containing protein [Haliangium sp.]|uniref:prenyltransferase/squalene oxidase repeat-containing protein n=1 Tax=Haliangium sp. TaxID=2663208 RepID=UPI003D12DA44
MTTDLVEWLSSADNPPVRYLTARDLRRPKPTSAKVKQLRAALWTWAPLQRIVALQREDGGFGKPKKPADARATLWALCLLQRCGLDVGDEPVARAVEYLSSHHLGAGALSYTSGGSGVLPCYQGVACAALIKLGALDSEIVQSSLRWLVAHQRFDHKATRAGGEQTWPYKAPANYGCWQSVSCYHGVAGTFRALAAVPPKKRSADMRRCLKHALEYLAIHHLYKRSKGDRPLFRHMTEPSLIGDYRSNLLDMLQGIADADPKLIRQPWVRAAADDMEHSTDGGRVTLTKNYGRALTSPIPLEPVGQPSRFLTLQWLIIRSRLAAAAPTSA